MSSIFFTIPITLVLLGIAVWFFFWAVNSGQYDDLDSPAYSILMEDDQPTAKTESGDGDPDSREETHRNDA